MKQEHSQIKEKPQMKEKYQQQILFDEDEGVDESKNLNILEHQEIFDNEEWQKEELDFNENDDIEDEKSRPHWLWRIILALFSVLVVIEAFEFFTIGFSESPIITSLYAALLFCISLIAGTTLIKEISGLRKFKHQQQLQLQAKAVFTEEHHISAQELCDKISKQLPCDLMSEQEQQWSDVVGINKADYSDKELLHLYSRLVLSKVDQKAMAEIAKFSTESVVLVALSPIAIVDMALILWRNLRMINKITGLYGLKLGYWSRIKLIKQVFVNMVYAGATELIADFGTDLIGADLLGKLSGRLAQGLGAGMLTARLGLKTMKLCRPIPFDPPSQNAKSQNNLSSNNKFCGNEAPKLSHIRKEIFVQVKQLLSKTSHRV